MFGDGGVTGKIRKRKRDNSPMVTGRMQDLLAQLPGLLESLKTLCPKHEEASRNLEIDSVTSELLIRGIEGDGDGGIE